MRMDNYENRRNKGQRKKMRLLKLNFPLLAVTSYDNFYDISNPKSIVFENLKQPLLGKAKQLLLFRKELIGDHSSEVQYQ